MLQSRVPILKCFVSRVAYNFNHLVSWHLAIILSRIELYGSDNRITLDFESVVWLEQFQLRERCVGSDEVIR